MHSVIMYLSLYFDINKFKDKNVPQAVMDVVEEELNKLSLLENHSSEFK